MNRLPHERGRPGRRASQNRQTAIRLPRLAHFIRPVAAQPSDLNPRASGNQPQRKTFTLQDIMSASSDIGDRAPTSGTPPPLVHDQGGSPSQGRLSDAGGGESGRKTASRSPTDADVAMPDANKVPGGSSGSEEAPPTVDAPPVVSAPNDGRPKVASPEEKRAAPSEPPSGDPETKTSDAPLGGSSDGLSSERPGDSRPPRMTILDSTRLGRLFPELAVRLPTELLTKEAKRAAASRMGVPSCIGAPPDFAILDHHLANIA